MIVFDLECSKRHVFEGWFDSIESFEEENARGLVICPSCEDTTVRRVMSPVAVKKSSPVDPSLSEGIDYRKLAKGVMDYINKNFEDVGSNFAAEALKIHYGVEERRNIKGSATFEEEKTLEEEGIEFFKVPVPEKDDDDKKPQ